MSCEGSIIDKNRNGQSHRNQNLTAIELFQLLKQHLSAYN